MTSPFSHGTEYNTLQSTHQTVSPAEISNTPSPIPASLNGNPTMMPFNRTVNAINRSSLFSVDSKPRIVENVNAKAQKIKEYLGINANISDHDFEALQNDIQSLDDSFNDPLGSFDTPMSMMPESRTGSNTLFPMTFNSQHGINHHTPSVSGSNYQARLNHMNSLRNRIHTLNVVPTLSPCSMPLPPVPATRARRPANTSDTEDSDPDDSYINSDHPDEELLMLRRYQFDWYEVQWRWSWLQLQVDQLKATTQMLDEAQKSLQEKKKLRAFDDDDDDDNNNNNGNGTNSENDFIARRCLPVRRKSKSKKKQKRTPLVPPPWHSIFLQLDPPQHPLFAENPKKKVFPTAQPLFEQRQDTLPVVKPAQPEATKGKSKAVKKPDGRDLSMSGKTLSSGKLKSDIDSKKRSKKRSASSKKRRLTAQNHGLSSSDPLIPTKKKSRRVSDFDINNVVLPNMGAPVHIRRIEYKEIFTPDFRVINVDDPLPSDEGSSSENTDEEIYVKLHAPKETDEHTRFAFPSPQKKKQLEKNQQLQHQQLNAMQQQQRLQHQQQQEQQNSHSPPLPSQSPERAWPKPINVQKSPTLKAITKSKNAQSRILAASSPAVVNTNLETTYPDTFYVASNQSTAPFKSPKTPTKTANGNNNIRKSSRKRRVSRRFAKLDLEDPDPVELREVRPTHSTSTKKTKRPTKTTRRKPKPKKQPLPPQTMTVYEDIDMELLNASTDEEDDETTGSGIDIDTDPDTDPGSPTPPNSPLTFPKTTVSIIGKKRLFSELDSNWKWSAALNAEKNIVTIRKHKLL